LLAHALSQGAAENIDATTGTKWNNESDLGASADSTDSSNEPDLMIRLMAVALA
jgi:hypothetical protein